MAVAGTPRIVVPRWIQLRETAAYLSAQLTLEPWGRTDPLTMTGAPPRSSPPGAGDG